MQNVMSFLIRHFVIAYLAIAVMHLLVAHKYQSHMNQSIHVIHRHAVKTRFVLFKMDMPNAHVFHHILETLTALDAGRSACIMQIVPVEWHVFDNIAVIHAPESADQTPNVLSLIMYQFAHVKETIKAIHSPAVDQHQNYVCIY